MNEVVQEIWTQLGAEPDPDAHGFAELTQEPALESEAYLQAITPLIRWLRCGYSHGHKRPSVSLYEALFGRGGFGACTAILDRYLEQASDPSEGLRLWRALAPAARLLRNRGGITWDLDSWRPGGDDEGKVRLVGTVSRDLDERVRALSFVTRRSLSDIVSDALAEYVARYERKSGALPRRTEAAAVASA